jgi:hypothetical protein
MSYSLEQIWLATPSNIDEILTSGKVEAIKNSGTLDEKRIKVARLYASPTYNFLNPSQVALVNSPDFDLTIKTYGLNKALTLLKRPTISLQQIKDTSDQEVTRFLFSQSLPVSSSAVSNKLTLTQFYFKNGMFNAEEATLIANPKFRQYVEEELDLKELKKPKVTLRQIWKLKIKMVNEFLKSVGVNPDDNPFLNRVILARLYAREGRLSDIDTRLINSLDFDRVFTRSGNFEGHYNYNAAKSMIGNVLPSDISTIVQGYAAIEAPKPEYIIINTSTEIIMIDSSTLEVTKRFDSTLRFTDMKYFNGMIFLFDDNSIFYCDSTEEVPILKVLDGYDPTAINKENGVFLTVRGNTRTPKFIVYDITSLPPKLKLNLSREGSRYEEDGETRIRIGNIFTVDDVFYTVGTSIKMYTLDGQLLGSTFIGAYEAHTTKSFLVGNYLVIYRDRPEGPKALFLYDRHSLKLVRVLEPRLPLVGNNKFKTDGKALYYVHTGVNFKRVLLKIDVETSKETVCLELTLEDYYILGFNGGRVYMMGPANPKPIIEIDLLTGERRTVVENIGVDSFYQLLLTFSS